VRWRKERDRERETKQERERDRERETDCAEHRKETEREKEREKERERDSVRGAPSIDTFILNSILLECFPVFQFIFFITVVFSCSCIVIILSLDKILPVCLQRGNTYMSGNNFMVRG
jgi:hypothetical protein